MTRVLVVEAAGKLWGSERALVDLLSSTMDCEFAVCCPPGEPIVRELQARGIRVLPYYVAGLHTKTRLARAKAALGVLRAALEFRPDVIHLNQGGAYRTSLPAAILLNRPLTAHVRLFEEIAHLAARRPAPRRLRALVAISHAVESEIARCPQLSGIATVQIYDPYTPGAHGGRNKPSAETPVRNPHRVVCAGRVEPMKGQALLLQALAHLGPQGEAVECLIVGDGDRGYIDGLKAANQAGVRIRWCGFVPDIIPLLRSAAVLAFPSQRETLGRVVFDAWQAGAVPVVYGGSGGAAELVQSADGGVVYAEQTPECLAAGLSAAIRLPRGEAQRLVRNGRRWMTLNADPMRCGQAMSALFADVAAPLVTVS